ncbi:ABC transporter ATP-binding protein [bacterium]|nr:MAG: ABC transporter ATP-binding protein [bacterium]
MIKIEDLHKSFGDNHVLKGINLEVRDGETLVIIGRSGCGKSVLLKHIVGLLKPDKGRVVVDGIEVHRVSRREVFDLRRRFGMVFQGAALFDSLTVKENVAIGLREHLKLSEEEIDRIVKEKLELVGLRNVEHLKPAELSGGMKKRVGIARALAMDPEYILYDEPTTGLDPIMADRINELILSLKHRLHKTTIVVTHDMKSAFKVGDRIAMIYDGRIIFEGTPEEVEKSDNPYVRQFVEGLAEGPIQ